MFCRMRACLTLYLTRYLIIYLFPIAYIDIRRREITTKTIYKLPAWLHMLILANAQYVLIVSKYARYSRAGDARN